MDKKNFPIGIIDSGVGGLTVLKAINKMLPCEDIIYLGDTAHLPYGAKSEDTITRLAISNMLFLINKKVKMAILACNSTSSVALPKIKDFFSLPVMGVVEAGVQTALRKDYRRIGVIGTPATIRSCAYQDLLKAKNPGVKVSACSCPLFVPLVEQGWISLPVSVQIARIYLNKFKDRIDALILGCTHYPLLKETIKKVLPKVDLIDSAQAMAGKVKGQLEQSRLIKEGGKGKIKVYLTDQAPNFGKLARMILKRSIKPELINNV